MADKSGKFVDEWGRSAAKQRYGSPGSGQKAPTGQDDPQSPEDKQGPKYENRTPDNWLRGMGKGQAEGKPSFDHVGKHPKGK